MVSLVISRLWGALEHYLYGSALQKNALAMSSDHTTSNDGLIYAIQLSSHQPHNILPCAIKSPLLFLDLLLAIPQVSNSAAKTGLSLMLFNASAWSIALVTTISGQARQVFACVQEMARLSGVAIWSYSNVFFFTVVCITSSTPSSGSTTKRYCHDSCPQQTIVSFLSYV
jgi:hypothetical protein